MSLLSGMNNILENKDAVARAEEEMMFNEMQSLDNEIVIEALVDGEAPFDEEIDTMVNEDFMEDEINKELDDEENSIAANNAADEKCCKEGKCCKESAITNEAAALTGSSFLAYLTRDTNDPITTKPGSIGQQSSAASFPTNYSDEFDDNNDPIKTKPGSIGQQSSSANHKENFSDEKKDNNDPIKTQPGSIGQKNSTAKDPTMESASFLSFLVGNNAMEGFTSATPEPEKPDPKKLIAGFQANSQVISNNADLLGIDNLDYSAIESFLDDKKFDEAINTLNEYEKVVESSVSNVTPDATTDPIFHAKDTMVISIESTILAIQMQKMIDSAMEAGTDPEIAQLNAIKKVKGQKNQMEINQTLTPSMESVIDLTVGYFEKATEGNCGCECSDDPECTEDGSVGQKDSKAHSDTNFSSGNLDTNDPVETKDGAEGQPDSAATFDDNHSGGKLDDFDPIKTEDGSVGQKDSTAKDPASESLNALDELEKLSKSLEEDMLTI